MKMEKALIHWISRWSQLDSRVWLPPLFSFPACIQHHHLATFIMASEGNHSNENMQKKRESMEGVNKGCEVEREWQKTERLSEEV